MYKFYLTQLSEPKGIVPKIERYLIFDVNIVVYKDLQVHSKTPIPSVAKLHCDYTVTAL